MLTGSQVHDKTADWWAFGVLVYEMLIGSRPFKGRNLKELINSIKNRKIIFPNREKYNFEYSDEIADLVLNLLQKQNERLGNNGGAEEVLAHPFF